MENNAFERAKLRAKMAVARIKVSAKEAAGKAAEWVSENKELVVVSVPVIAGAAGMGMKMHTQHQRKKNLELEQQVKELYVYDNHLGHYWRVKKPLTNVQWRLIETRKALGEPLGQILEDLKLLD